MLELFHVVRHIQVVLRESDRVLRLLPCIRHTFRCILHIFVCPLHRLQVPLAQTSDCLAPVPVNEKAINGIRQTRELSVSRYSGQHTVSRLVGEATLRF